MNHENEVQIKTFFSYPNKSINNFSSFYEYEHTTSSSNAVMILFHHLIIRFIPKKMYIEKIKCIKSHQDIFSIHYRFKIKLEFYLYRHLNADLKLKDKNTF